MTSNRFLHKRKRGLYSSAKSAQMNKARWDADRARRDAEMPERIRQLAEIEVMNLPRKFGDLTHIVQIQNISTGKISRWTIRRGDRSNSITWERVGGRRSLSCGVAVFVGIIRGYLCGRKV